MVKKIIVTFKSPEGYLETNLLLILFRKKVGEINNVIEGNNTIGGLVNHHING